MTSLHKQHSLSFARSVVVITFPCAERIALSPLASVAKHSRHMIRWHFYQQRPISSWFFFCFVFFNSSLFYFSLDQPIRQKPYQLSVVCDTAWRFFLKFLEFWPARSRSSSNAPCLVFAKLRTFCIWGRWNKNSAVGNECTRSHGTRRRSDPLAKCSKGKLIEVARRHSGVATIEGACSSRRRWPGDGLSVAFVSRRRD